MCFLCTFIYMLSNIFTNNSTIHTFISLSSVILMFHNIIKMSSLFTANALRLLDRSFLTKTLRSCDHSKNNYNYFNLFYSLVSLMFTRFAGC